MALVARGNRVLWVCGMDISEDAKLSGPPDEAALLACRYEYTLTSDQ